MKKKLLSFFTIVIMIFCLSAFTVYADSTVDVSIYGTYSYSNANQVLELINGERADQGLSPLKMDPNLTEYAMQRAAELSVYYSHTRPDGSRFSSVITGGEYSSGTKGENIAIGQVSASAVMSEWMNSEEQRQNILNTVYKSVGIGCFRQDDGQYCWVQLFYENDLDYSYSASGTSKKTSIPVSIRTDLVKLYISGLSGGDIQIKEGLNSEVRASVFYGKTTPITLKLQNTSEEVTTDIKTALSSGYSFTSGNSSLIGVNASGFIARAKGATTMSFSLGNSYSGSFPVGVFDEVTFNIQGVSSQTKQVVNFSWDNSSGDANLLMYQNPDSGNLWYKQSDANNLEKPLSPSIDVNLTTGSNNTDGETRIYRVFTLLDDDTGRVFPVSDPVEVTTVTYPENITVSNVISTGKPKISWDKVEGAVKYIVLRNLEPVGTATGTSFVDTTAEFGETYEYQVLSENEYGCRSVKSGSYGPSVEGTAILPAPTVKASNVASTGKVKLTWNAVEGASKYIVYTSTTGEKNSWSKYTTSTTSLTHSSGQRGIRYYYKVQAVHSDTALNSGTSASVIRCCDLARPTVTISNVQSTGKIKLSWDSVPGAAGYEVYRSTTKTGSYTRMYTTTDTSYTNTSAKAGTVYYYKVKAIHASNSSAHSAYSTTLKRACDLPRPVVTVSNSSSSGKIRVSWEPVSGAEKYEIYRSTSKNGSYKLLKTTTKTSVINTINTDIGTTYYYKVRAIHPSNSSANSAFSVIKARTCDLPRPVVNVTYTDDGKPKLTWDDVEGAVRYEVWRSDAKNGTYKKVGTIKGTVAVHTRAVSGETYYYKVTAIHSKETANSGYSLIISATAK